MSKNKEEVLRIARKLEKMINKKTYVSKLFYFYIFNSFKEKFHTKP